MTGPQMVDYLEGLIEEFAKNVAAVKTGKAELAIINISGFFFKRNGSERNSFWSGTFKSTLNELLETVVKGDTELDTLSRALNPKRVAILLACIGGASESELAERLGLKGGALHHHIKELLLTGLLKKEGRGKYKTTKFGNFVVTVALSGIRTLQKAEEGGEEE